MATRETTAQPAAKVHRVAYVALTSPRATLEGENPQNHFARAFFHGLRERGYSEGKNLVIERRSLEGRLDQAPATFAELITRGVDVIVAPTNPMVKAAKVATSTVPIVMIIAMDTVSEGLVASLARPGGNVTGFDITPNLEELQKPLQFLKETIPGISKVAAVTGLVASNPELVASWRQHLGSAAQLLRISLAWVEVKSAADVGQALALVEAQRPDGMLLLPSLVVNRARASIISFAARHRIPVTSTLLDVAREGGLLAYAADGLDLYRRAAGHVDKILRGAKPADLPVEHPTKYVLVVNLKSAAALGVTVPRSVLARADEIVE